MNPERLAVAAPHGVDPGKVRGGGDIPEFTAEDVAGAMGMGHLSRLQAEILLVGYCGHARSKLWALTLMEIEHWRPRWMGHRVAHRIARAALDVVVPPERRPGQEIPSDRCQHCGGSRVDLLDPKRSDCKPCGGSGYAPLPIFARPWDRRLAELIHHLRGLEADALDALEFGG